MAQFNKITIIIFPATWLPREERRIKCLLFWFCSFTRLIAQFNKSKIFQFPVTWLPHGEIRFLHPVSVFQSSERLIDGRKTPDYALYSELFTPELARQIVLGKLYIYVQYNWTEHCTVYTVNIEHYWWIDVKYFGIYKLLDGQIFHDKVYFVRKKKSFEVY